MHLRYSRPIALSFLSLIAPIGAARAQGGGTSIRVARVAGAIALDGHLDEPAWALADSITSLRQREPAVGADASERTIVKLLRDDQALYVAVAAYDADPAAIVATQLRRDADLGTDDHVVFFVDGLHDQRSAFFFATNPNGAMWDAQFTGVDEDNVDWNGIWEVRTARGPTGWSAEFRIPFRTLRFRAGGDGLVGFNLQRFVRRKNETDLWRGWGRSEGLYRLNYAGTLSGLEDVRGAREVAIKPYLLGSAATADHDPTGAETGASEFSGKAGLDAKIGLTSALTADLTLNTDFAQVEVDQQVINLTRFPTFFPEKRDFFLESSGIFDFGTPGRIQPFYSRRIGLAADGSAIPIVAGARVTGRSGAWTLGMLDVQTGGTEDANDLVLRVKHDLLARSYLGAIGISRWRNGETERLIGADIDLPLVVHGHNVEPSIWAMGSSTPSAAGTPVAWRLSTDYPNDLWDNFVSLYRIDRGFDPALGFARQTGIWQVRGHIDYTPRPHRFGVRQLDLELPFWDIVAPDSGSLLRSKDWETADFEIHPLAGEFQSGASFQVSIQRSLDAPRDSFAISSGVVVPPGRYWWTRGGVGFETSRSHPVSVGGEATWGDFYDGTDAAIDLGVDWRSGGHLILGGSLTRDHVALPGGSFTATEAAGRIEYAFDTRTSFLGFGQYNSEDERVDFNLRFHWIPKVGDDLFVVWNSGYTTDPGVPHRFPSRFALQHPLNGAFVIKATHHLSL